MLAVVNQPRTRNTEGAAFRIEGDIPKFVLVFLESAFRDSVKIEELDDEDSSVNVDEWDWYKENRTSMSVGESIKADRGLRGWTQKTLAQKLGIPVQNVSDLERNVRPVSRSMASKLGEVFCTDPSRFFDFKKK